MRKGAKRKRSQKEEEAAPARAPDNHKTTESTKPPTRAKRVKASKPEPEPEYFEDQRNLEDLWKQIFPVGTEWDQLDKVYGFNWNFSNLENAFEEGGVLHGKTVYLFGCTEPQLVPFKDENILIYIPAVVAVVSPFPPSNKIGIKSVQREVEEIIPMKQMKMDWVPYIPLEDRESRVDRLRHQIFILSCTQRRFLVARTDCSSISLLLPIFTKYILQSYIVFKLLTGICGQLIWYFCCWIIQFYVSAFENYYHIIHFNRNNLTFCYILVSNFSFFLGYMHLLIWQLDGILLNIY
nr:protein HEAT INTOLERANT 4-like isoform X2 [Populus alba]